jgi:putative PIN family toxin of toxin-antitoxin system
VTIVLDTNVIVAALVAKGLCHEVVVRALGACTVVTSMPLLDELEQTLRAKFTLGPAANAFLKQLRGRVRLVEPVTLPSPVSRDADDDVVLATAIAAEAAVIVTGDRDLLIIGRYGDVDIVSPREFLTRLAP